MGARIYVRELGPYVSEGSRLLWEVICRRGINLSQAGTELGIDAPSVGRFLRGKKRPGGTARGVLHDRYGIKPSAWDEVPREPFALGSAA